MEFNLAFKGLKTGFFLSAGAQGHRGTGAQGHAVAPLD